MTRVLVVGGGIGGLAAALAVARGGCAVQLLEKSAAFTEVGAGIQIGPNVTRVLRNWGLQQGLDRVAAYPEQLEVRSAGTGGRLGGLCLGDAMVQRYGAPYATLHRADLHRLLLDAVAQQPAAQLQLACAVKGLVQTPAKVILKTGAGLAVEGDALVGADGVWSTVRQLLLNDGAPRTTGHLAYRALVPQASLPERLRSKNVTVWLGPRMHVVQYPVRGGDWLNIVAIVHGEVADQLHNWDHSAHGADLAASMASSCFALQELVQAVPAWRLWVLHDRAPLQGAAQHAAGRVALLGDAAHPMRPYLAQGAGMAIEDAAELGALLGAATLSNVPAALQQYAANRWQRNARVQARALRNGNIFHAQGPMRWGRDVAMKLLGERLLDMPWLYGFSPKTV